MKRLSKRCGVYFNPPLNLHAYIYIAPFPSRLTVAKGSTLDKKTYSIQSSRVDESPPAKGKMKWVKVEDKPKNEEHQVIFSGNLPVKCGDPNTFSLLWLIGKMKFEHAILGLGFAINIMPASMYFEIQ